MGRELHEATATILTNNSHKAFHQALPSIYVGYQTCLVCTHGKPGTEEKTIFSDNFRGKMDRHKGFNSNQL